MRARRLFLSTLALLPLAACGRKGPLTLPPDEQPAKQKPPAATAPDAQGAAPPKPPAN